MLSSVKTRIDGSQSRLKCPIISESVIGVRPSGSLGAKTDGLMLKPPTGVGRKPKLLNNLTEYLGSLPEMKTNEYIMFPMLNPCRLTFATYPVLRPHLGSRRHGRESYLLRRFKCFVNLFTMSTLGEADGHSSLLVPFHAGKVFPLLTLFFVTTRQSPSRTLVF